MWVSWIIITGKGSRLGIDMNEWVLADELTEVVTYCCVDRNNKEATVAGKLMLVKFYHERWGGLELPWKHFRINQVGEIFKRAPVEAENHAQVNRPPT